MTRLLVAGRDCGEGGKDFVRPCPFSECRYHISAEPEEVKRCGPPTKARPSGTDSCAIDVADRGPSMLREVAALFGTSRERIRQIEQRGLRKLRKTAPAMGVDLSLILTRYSIWDEIEPVHWDRDGSSASSAYMKAYRAKRKAAAR